MEKNKSLQKNLVSMFMTFFLLVMLCILPAIAQKVGDEKNIEIKATDLARVQVGTSAPNFNLESVDGKWVKLSSYQSSKNVILVFYRGYW